MNIDKVVVGSFDVNCFVIEVSPGKAIVVDPGADPEEIAEFLRNRALSPIAYLLTHGHMDHISGLSTLYSLLPAPIALHAEDTAWAFSASNQMLPYYDIPAKPADIEIELKGCAGIPNLGVRCDVIHTPGHTPGSVCFHFPETHTVITGDTLFAGSVGRTDFPGGSTRELNASLKKLKILPDATDVYPGHGSSSTIGREKKTNYFMQAN